MSPEEEAWKLWDRFATHEAKGQIFLWLLAGLIYNFVTGRLLSLSTVILIFPGIFIASLLAFPGALMNAAKVRSVMAMKIGARPKNILVLLGWTCWYVIDLVYVPALAILTVRLIQWLVGA